MKSFGVLLILSSTVANGARIRHYQPSVDLEALLKTVSESPAFKSKVEDACAQDPNQKECRVRTTQFMFCNLLRRNKPEAYKHSNCPDADSMNSVVSSNGTEQAQAKTDNTTTTDNTEGQVMEKDAREATGEDAANTAKVVAQGNVTTVFSQLAVRTKRSRAKAPEDELAKEMTHDLEMNFNKIAPFGKEDTAKELQDHAAKTQDTLVDAVENAEVAEIKRAVFRALTRLRAATIKEFDTIARLETQAIDAYNDAHHYRAENPLTHLHEDEAPVETDKLKSFH